MNILTYIFIFVFKMIEVTIGTSRIVLIARGERLIGSILAFFEVILWVILVSTVVTNISDDPIKVLFYALGFACGNYTGSRLEEKLGIGNARVEAIVMEENGKKLADLIRKKGYGVTVIEGEGMHNKRNLLIMNIRRKDYQYVISLIKKYEENVVITINDIKPIYGGFGMLKR